MLAKLQRGNSGFSLQPLSASGNNRVFTLLCDGEKLVLKWYFHDDADTRDRLGAEYAFLEHAWSMGLRCIPQPLGKDSSNYLALYEFVEGRKLNVNQVDSLAIQQAAKFFALLNSPHSRKSATALPIASEACFSVMEHFAMVDARLVQLGYIPVESEIDVATAKFVNRLNNYWYEVKARLLDCCAELELKQDDVVGSGERCLSPSDFGFHNALMRPDGSFCFIDFEYAGWDDPAKVVGDFFSHPGVEVPHDQFEPFLAQALAPFQNPDRMAARVRLLKPIFQVKWCCIILNEFLPVATKRRNFANPGGDAMARKSRQLDKATKLFNSLPH